MTLRNDNINIETQCKAIFGRRTKLIIYRSGAASPPQTYCHEQRIRQYAYGEIKLISLKRPQYYRTMYSMIARMKIVTQGLNDRKWWLQG